MASDSLIKHKIHVIKIYIHTQLLSNYGSIEWHEDLRNVIFIVYWMNYKLHMPNSKRGSSHASDQCTLCCLFVTKEQLEWKQFLHTMLDKQLQLDQENQDADYWQTHK